VVTQEESEQILRLYEGLRVTDVCDGMDSVGLQDLGLMDSEIKPLWRDIEGFKHRVCGMALTVRIVPTNKRGFVGDPWDHFRWKKDWRKMVNSPPWTENIKSGDIIVVDATGTREAGFIGSNNSLGWMRRGARGIVTNEGCRDTDELIKQRVPVYCRHTARGITPGRMEIESVNRPINCGGVLVRPGDVVVADGDGVIVVPLEKAKIVAEIATKIQEDDKRGRRRHYEALGIPLDFTLEPRKSLQKET